ncbi:MAG: N-acetylmuramic acid 6-phosphate etherase [Clostridiales bacterium]|nr:N-acetylmuramic acid 6-phosphate etherase [Clostridiales bacterium]
MVRLREGEKAVLSELKTESRNPKTLELDKMSVRELLTVMNEEDRNVYKAVKEVIPEIEKTVHAVVDALGRGGRLIYTGAGTSGRLGILDAVECVPTFSTMDEVKGIIAGGEQAFVRAKEGAEDSREDGAGDLEAINVCERDVVVALSASGRTPYCLGALEYARKNGACCVGLSCNRPAVLSAYSDIAIEVDAGPEILTGSTRLKAGTAEKLILNMISTAAMVGIGKVYKNLMVDMKATNLKLEDRTRRIVQMACECTEETAEKALTKAMGDIKAAIVMIETGISLEEAERRLSLNNGFVRRCLQTWKAEDFN